jgi:hypothetical protein
VFDTKRFIDVTNQKQMKKGTLCFRDSYEPNVYYLSHLSGYVLRVIKTKSQIIYFESGKVVTEFDSKKYQVNKRSNNGNGLTSVLLPKLNDRLDRIQRVANKFKNKSTSSNSYTEEGKFSIVISPDVT